MDLCEQYVMRGLDIYLLLFGAKFAILPKSCVNTCCEMCHRNNLKSGKVKKEVSGFGIVLFIILDPSYT